MSPMKIINGIVTGTNRLKHDGWGWMPHSDWWRLADVRGRCGRSAPRAAKPQKANQCSGSSLRWVVFCRHIITKSKKVANYNVPSWCSSGRKSGRQR